MAFMGFSSLLSGLKGALTTLPMLQPHLRQNSVDGISKSILAPCPILTIESTTYVLQPQSLDPRQPGHESLSTPLILVAADSSVPITKVALETLFEYALQDDDILSPHFLGEILFTGITERDANLSQDAQDYLRNHGAARVGFTKDPIAVYGHRLSGAFIAEGGKLWKPYRTYEDFNNAFVVALWPAHSSAECDSLDASASTFAYRSGSQVAVPSRSRYILKPTESKPLNGLRIAIKDIFDVQGTLTTLCSRAYAELYPPANKTAESVQILLDAGAVLLGKTRLCSFISKELATEAIDYSTPFNPRADGYQSPWGSSTGSASAVSSYDWLDVAIGSDTNGSGRRPANVHGLFGFRASKDLIPMTGVFPSFGRFDVPCLFSRDLDHISRVMDVYQALSESPMTRAHSDYAIDTILYPSDFLPTSNPGQMEAIDAFVSDLERHLGIKRTIVSISESWRKTHPRDIDNDDLHSFLDKAGWAPVFYDGSQSVKTFQKDYLDRFGKLPYATPYNKWKWSLGDQVTKTERDEEIQKLDVYRSWLLEELFKTSSRTAIMILPIDEPTPTYRDAQPQAPSVRSGDLPLNLSPSMGAPELTIPLTDIPYESLISGRTEFLPVTVSILGTPGTDAQLINSMMSALKEIKRPMRVRTGSRMFGTSPA